MIVTRQARLLLRENFVPARVTGQAQAALPVYATSPVAMRVPADNGYTLRYRVRTKCGSQIRAKWQRPDLSGRREGGRFPGREAVPPA